MNSAKPFIIAHRGSSANAPENTLAAFQKAIDEQADGIEFDVRLAKDGVPVIFHDATLKRLAKIKNRVDDFTAEELSRVDVGSWFNRAFPSKNNQAFSAETIPTFARLLEFLRDYQGLIYVELKGKREAMPALAGAICELIEKSELQSKIIVKSFKLEAIRIVKERSPEIRTAALFEPKILTILGKEKRILEEAKSVGADEISLHYSMATRKFVQRARENNFTIVIWTANNPKWVKRSLDYGIDAVITNHPAALLAARSAVLS